jgi:hypothetical protein
MSFFCSTRLKNIEDTERAKRKLIDDTEREEKEQPNQNGRKNKNKTQCCKANTSLILY